ncbi:hypothetical protein AB0B66_12930 [Catellatospora sp. NPDC049111]|uniref:hypothetical protein n=1 Tax=Catellatospora sp. NPDC049111 TaxID=3155271 RepID=UPI0034018758
MPVEVRDLVPAFLDFWQQAAEASTERQLALWRDYVTCHPEVVHDVIRDGGEPDPAPAFARYPELIGRITANAPLATGWIEEAARLVAPVLQAQDLTVPCVSMVGLARSNGWVSELAGRHTLFLAVEQVPAADAARILTTHEMAHAIQLRLPEARAEILACLDTTEPGVQRRYLNLNGWHHLPDRIGYLVGVRAVGQLRRAYSWAELARWGTDRAMVELRRVLAGCAES